jgi:hypothetical protein
MRFATSRLTPARSKLRASEIVQEKIPNTGRFRQLLPRSSELLYRAPFRPGEYGVVRLFSFDTDAQKIINLLRHFNNAAFVVLL